LTSAFTQLFRQDLMALHLAQLPFSSGLFVARTVLSGQMTSAGHGLSESRAAHPGGRLGRASDSLLKHISTIVRCVGDRTVQANEADQSV
jgi:hypothetical protein